MKADDIVLYATHEMEKNVRDILRKNKGMWSGQPEEINITEIRIDLVPDAKPFKSAPYRAGPKTRNLKAPKYTSS